MLFDCWFDDNNGFGISVLKWKLLNYVVGTQCSVQLLAFTVTTKDKFTIFATLLRLIIELIIVNRLHQHDLNLTLLPVQTGSKTAKIF